MRDILDSPATTLHGMQFSNPGHVKEAFKAVSARIDELIEQINDKMNEPSNIVIEGQTLTQVLGEQQWKRGNIKIHHGSWASALEETRDGAWKICDGRNGTPNYHPMPGDSSGVQRFLRATLWGRDAGDTADTSTHYHAYAHDHTITSHADATKCTCAVCPGAGVNAIVAHTLCNHTIGVEADDTDAASHLPPYAEVIFLMKM